MADNKTPSTTETAQSGSRQGTASPIPAQQGERAIPSPTSRQGTASLAPAQQQEVLAANEPSTESTANTTTQEADAQDEQEDLPVLGEYHSDSNSAFGGSIGSTGSTSISSSVRAGEWMQGRRYQVLRDNRHNVPSDEKQFESMHAGHLAFTVMESLRQNPFFRSPISKNAQRIIDLGTGSGGWVNDVADAFRNITVYGVDLYPPPQDWVAPNSIFEVDDITKPWLWPHKFDFVHLRMLLSALPRHEWKILYRRIYDNLEPGGWIEHVDVDAHVYSMEPKPLPEDSVLNKWFATLYPAARQTGHSFDVTDWMKQDIEEAGFVNLHETDFKVPLGEWPQHPIYKEAGRLSMIHFKEGCSGWVTWLLMKYGQPTSWTAAEVEVWLALVRKELAEGYHTYQSYKRVWAQKPYDTPAESKQPEVVNLEKPIAAASKP